VICTGRGKQVKEERRSDAIFEIRTTLTFGDGSHGFGPNKMSILEAIDQYASLSGASKATGISYNHVWMMIGQMNRDFREPVVLTKLGRSGGASLTPMGTKVLTQFRAMEKKIAAAASSHLALFAGMISEIDVTTEKKAKGKRSNSRSKKKSSVSVEPA
jgi:molybdate transport system regulatory protein